MTPPRPRGAGRTPTRPNCHVLSLACADYFHTACIDRWFSARAYQQRTCPLCKRDPLEGLAANDAPADAPAVGGVAALLGFRRDNAAGASPATNEQVGVELAAPRPLPVAVAVAISSLPDDAPPSTPPATAEAEAAEAEAPEAEAPATAVTA